MKNIAAMTITLLLALSPVFAVAEGGTPATIDIKDYKFAPAALTVHAGDTVTWINHDDIPHTVAEKDKTFRSAALDTGDKFSHRFPVKGTYTYFCTLHPQMTGTVTVQ